MLENSTPSPRIPALTLPARRYVSIVALVLMTSAILTTGCPSGLPDASVTVRAADEPLPDGVKNLGINLGFAANIVGTRTVGIDGVGTFTFVLFTTSTSASTVDREAPLDTNGAEDVFVAALDNTGTVKDIVLVSRGQYQPTPRAGNDASTNPSMTFAKNGAFDPADPANTNPAGFVHVVFESLATNIDTGDANAFQDVFMASVWIRASEDPATGQPATEGLNLAVYPEGQANPYYFYQYSNTIVSRSLSGSVANGPSFRPVIMDGATQGSPPFSYYSNVVLFESEATNLVAPEFGTDVNGTVRDVFRRMVTQTQHPDDHGCGSICTDCGGCHSGVRAYSQRTDLISRTASGDSGSGPSFRPFIALGQDGGELITFESDAANLLSGDNNGKRDVFYSRIMGLEPDFDVSGVMHRASLKSDGTDALGGDSRNASIAPIGPDGDSSQALVAFESDADLGAPRPPGTTTNVYLHDSRGPGTGTTTLLNQRIGPEGATLGTAQGGGAPADSFRPRLDARASRAVFDTLADNLDLLRPGDTNGVADVLIADIRRFLDSGNLQHHRVSVTSGGATGDGASMGAAIASFTAAAGAGGPEAFSTHLLAKFTNPRCVNCHSFNATTPHGSFFGHQQVSDDSCENCHCPDKTGVPDEAGAAGWRAPPPEFSFHDKTPEELCAQAQLHPGFPDALTHLTQDARIQWALGETGIVPCWRPSDTGCDGTNSKTPVPGGLAQWTAQATEWVNDGFLCTDFGATGGDVVTYSTQATNLGAPAGGGTVLGFLSHTKVERMSKTTGWAPGGGKQVNGSSTAASITRDDRFIAFETNAPISASDTNGVADVYVRDLLLGTTTLVSHREGSSAAANRPSTNPSAHVAGGVLHVAFESLATNLVPDFVDGNGGNGSDVYWASFAGFDGVDAATIEVELASGAMGSATQGADGSSSRPSLGGSGPLFVAFDSTASNLMAGFTDGNAAAPDVFRRQLVGGSTVDLVSHSASGATTGGNGGSSNASISGFAANVAFESSATDLVAGFAPGAGATNVFLNFVGGGSLLVSRSTAGATTGGDGASSNASLNLDGGFVAFESTASDLVAGFTDGNASEPDVFLRQIVADITVVVSRSTSAATDGGDGGSSHPSVSPNGTEVAFDSTATNLISDDADDAVSGIYLFSSAAVVRLSQNQDDQNADGASIRPSLGSTGGVTAFESLAGNLVGPVVDTNGKSDVFRRDR